jgi:hypothetical protein
MFETLGEWNESVNPTGAIDRDFTLTILPGIRHAFNLPDEAQLVLGVGAPISFTGGQREYGVFLYLSFEHKFLR